MIVDYLIREEGNHGGVAIDASDLNQVKEYKYILENKPEIALNRGELLNENAERHVIDAIKVKSLLLHFLVDVLDTFGGKHIHISIDYLFSGNKSSNTEDDQTDWYNMHSKFNALGEVIRVPHLTLQDWMNR
ncbi:MULTISPECIES: Rossmann-fold NAD(P)-binding domain-containing protein [Bacillus]|uniref:Uncharacterized protein n=2 Tax=Bacillus TaxID=1386 RepID=A0A0M3R9W4_9BACI|nr:MULTISPECIES: hypothetical protein [Bacillus]ALC82142.1 hypothetical protein AM592_11515 [Bacillus gobiensis]MBP1080958.1 dTDP-4-dehydrorhamnose reductase [Bacillus capparidis]MED1095660.1 hypothetical protein [Bacillus capparidis]